jgi:hypothetical protein
MDWVASYETTCPFCFETFAITIDTSQGDHSMIEDCTVCCRPIEFNVRCEPGEVIEVTPERA